MATEPQHEQTVALALVGDTRSSEAGLILALRRVMVPLLLVGLPVAWVVTSSTTGQDYGIEIGFDFRGTLWEPARAVLHGGPIYADATRDAVVVGNPSAYPPLSFLLALPLALLPVTTAAWIWTVILGGCVGGALRIVGLRDWRLFVLVFLSPVVLQGLLFGNLTLALMVPVAVAWRYRASPWVAGTAIAVAVAAKLFLWPMVFWLLFTRRFKAAFIAGAVAVALVVLPWALIGFEGFADYPGLLRAVQDVYARVSLSLATVLTALGVATSLAVALGSLAGLALVGLAWWLAGQADGDRRSFSAIIGACIIASPIVWGYYTALLFIPIAITWKRLAPAWFFGYAVWLTALLPKPTVNEPVPCCKPPDMPEILWLNSHADPAWGNAGGTMAVVLVVIAALVARSRFQARRPTHERPSPAKNGSTDPSALSIG